MGGTVWKCQPRGVGGGGGGCALMRRAEVRFAGAYKSLHTVTLASWPTYANDSGPRSATFQRFSEPCQTIQSAYVSVLSHKCFKLGMDLRSYACTLKQMHTCSRLSSCLRLCSRLCNRGEGNARPKAASGPSKHARIGVLCKPTRTCVHCANVL